MPSAPDPRVNYWRWAAVQPGDDGGDTACLVLFFLVATVLFCAFLIVAQKPAWLPFKERDAGLSALTALAGLLYCWATLVTDDHAPAWLITNAGSSRLWHCWLRVVLGFALWSSCVLVRLHAITELYINDEEPVWFVIKLLQFLFLWVVAAVLVSTRAVELSMAGATLALTGVHVFYALYLGAPVMKMRDSVPDFTPAALCLLLAYANNLWISIAIELDIDNPPGESKARRVLSTWSTLLLVGGHMLATHGPLVYKLFQTHGHPLAEFLQEYEGGSARQGLEYMDSTGLGEGEGEGGEPGEEHAGQAALQSATTAKPPPDREADEAPRWKRAIGMGQKRRPLRVTKVAVRPKSADGEP